MHYCRQLQSATLGGQLLSVVDLVAKITMPAAMLAGPHLDQKRGVSSVFYSLTAEQT